MGVTFGVVGAGRMGTIVANKLPDTTHKIIVDYEIDKAKDLADKVQGTYSNNYDILGNADIIALVLPTPVINKVLKQILDNVKPGAIILNMATTGHIDNALKTIRNDVDIIDAKIIGHAMSMSKGEPGALVIKCENEDKYNAIKEQFIYFGDVYQGDADLVEKIAVIGSTEGIRTAVTVRKKLEKMNIPKEWSDVVIRTVCAGTMKSYTENDLGHFAMELAKKLEKEIN